MLIAISQSATTTGSSSTISTASTNSGTGHSSDRSVLNLDMSNSSDRAFFDTSRFWITFRINFPFFPFVPQAVASYQHSSLP